MVIVFRGQVTNLNNAVYFSNLIILLFIKVQREAIEAIGMWGITFSQIEHQCN